MTTSYLSEAVERFKKKHPESQDCLREELQGLARKIVEEIGKKAEVEGSDTEKMKHPYREGCTDGRNNAIRDAVKIVSSLAELPVVYNERKE